MFPTGRKFISENLDAYAAQCEETRIREQLVQERENEAIVGEYTAWYERGNFDRGVEGFLVNRGFLPARAQ
jgi:hypothetical protein